MIQYLNKPVFILGHSRSGTSLLLSLLDGHPDLLTFPGEMQGFKIINDPTPDNCLFKTGLKHAFQGQHALKNVNADLVRNNLVNYLSKAVTHKDVILAIIQAYEKCMGALPANVRYWVEKTGNNYRYIPTIEKWFGHDVKYVWILRDPRDVFNSVRTKKHNFDRYIFAVRWALMIRLIDIFGKLVQGRLLVIKYEDLVSNEEKTMRDVAEFIGIEFSEKLLIPTRNGMPMGEHSSAGGEVKWWREKVDTASLGKRSKYLTENDLRWLEERLNPEMHLWGYETPIKNRVFDLAFIFSVYSRVLLCLFETWCPLLQTRIWKAERVNLIQRGTARALARRDSLG